MLSVLVLCGTLPLAHAGTRGGDRHSGFEKRFGKNENHLGFHLGWGYTIDLPPGRDRTDMGLLSFFPYYNDNLTGVVGESFYRGAFYWHVEAAFVDAVDRGGKYLFGFSPLMFEYKFLSPKRKWAPKLLGGAGFSYTNFKDEAKRELGSEFEFLLHAGAGLDLFKRKSGSISINYRLFHVSNARIKTPNIGLNAHVFTLGVEF